MSSKAKLSRLLLAAAAGAVLACAATPAAAAAPPVPAWVQDSNKAAQPLLTAIAQFNPESATQLGVEGYDDKVIDLQPRTYERGQEALQKAVDGLKAQLPGAADPSFKQDLEIMIKAGQQQIDTNKLQYDLMLPYFSVSQVVFAGLHDLLDPRVSKERQALALVRLRRYAGLEPGSTAVADLAKSRIAERFDDKNLTGPYKAQVEQDLADSPQLMAGLPELFKKAGLSGYEEPLNTLTAQVKAYDAWIAKDILPRSRADNRLPPAIYADNLKQFGNTVPPDELIRRALVSFAEIRNEMRALAPLVAKQKGYKSADYRDVIRELKKQQLVGKAILPFYQKRLATIEDILRREHEITVPERKAVIRLASEAETAQLPAPHMSPPRLIGNTGEYGEFVLPLKTPGKAGEKDLKTDDFTFDAAGWTLTAHEARMGHELQFSAMMDHGVSIARAVFAFNSVNVEGWALYSEAELKPYFPLDGQLIGLQHRMMRAARAFLDPMVNLGMIKPEQVRQFLIDQVCLSEGLAKEETDRYTFRAPGQATSYFVGYQAMMETRQRAELALGAKFDKQRFHDFVLAQGLLPPDLLQKAVMEQFVPEQQGK
ncbi:MAG TPA: DUF885 domain-containing protein [Nevskia sp.]|nr:DUF885 domain-containing protein [Nevskia sp.]